MCSFPYFSWENIRFYCKLNLSLHKAEDSCNNPIELRHHDGCRCPGAGSAPDHQQPSYRLHKKYNTMWNIWANSHRVWRLIDRVKYQVYFGQFVTNGFYPKIVQPCRFTKKTGSVIDHTFCKLSENTSKSYSGILISNMADPLPHFTCLDILSNQQKPPKYIIKLKKHDEASLLSFYNEIEISPRNTHFPKWTNNRSKCYILLETNILFSKEKHLKPVKTKSNHYKHKNNLWFTNVWNARKKTKNN